MQEAIAMLLEGKEAYAANPQVRLDNTIIILVLLEGDQEQATDMRSNFVIVL